MTWDRAGLEARGFKGFARFASLPSSNVPGGAGVYVVYRESLSPPRFLEVSGGGHFKGRDPSVPVDVLYAEWVTGTHVMNIGKAAISASGRRGLTKRLDEYRQFGEGRPVGHWGGRYIWQLADSAALLVAWKVTPGQDPRVVERDYISCFKKKYDNRRPFANRQN